MGNGFGERFAKNLNVLLPFHLFIILTLIIASVYYFGIKSGMIIIGSWSSYAYLIAPATFGISLFISLLVPFFKALKS